MKYSDENLYGFIEGIPPEVGDYLCYASVQPHDCPGYGRPVHGLDPVRGFWNRHISHGMIWNGFMDDMGWIGWKATCLIYHPIPVETRENWLCLPYVWDHQFLKIIAK